MFNNNNKNLCKNRRKFQIKLNNSKKIFQEKIKSKSKKLSKPIRLLNCSKITMKLKNVFYVMTPQILFKIFNFFLFLLMLIVQTYIFLINKVKNSKQYKTQQWTTTMTCNFKQKVLNFLGVVALQKTKKKSFSSQNLQPAHVNIYFTLTVLTILQIYLIN